MPADPNHNGYPYTTYYFRTHFTSANSAPGTALLFSSYIDDGAVFYLNGAELYRVRMDPPPAPITNGTLRPLFRARVTPPAWTSSRSSAPPSPTSSPAITFWPLKCITIARSVATSHLERRSLKPSLTFRSRN